MPRRLLTHPPAQKTDLSRSLRHESSLDQAAPTRVIEGDEAINYGLWWHETMEFMPWRGDAGVVEEYFLRRLTLAAGVGMGQRAQQELMRLRASAIWSELSSDRWEQAAELAVFSPVAIDAWIDGVMDLVLHDAVRCEIWIVDWKTNRQRPNENERDLLARLASEYAPQLSAYGISIAGVFPGTSARLVVYSSVAGDWVDVEAYRENPLYSPSKATHVNPSKKTTHHGKSEKETPSEDVEAQAPQAP